jgi:hypothetical protein
MAFDIAGGPIKHQGSTESEKLPPWTEADARFRSIESAAGSPSQAVSFRAGSQSNMPAGAVLRPLPPPAEGFTRQSDVGHRSAFYSAVRGRLQ